MITTIIIIIVIITMAIIFYKLIHKTNNDNNDNANKLDQPFYEPYEIYPELSLIHDVSEDIIKEVKNLNETWTPWPETYLYDKKGSWNVFPIYINYRQGNLEDQWSKYHDKLPTLTAFLKKIPGLRVATLSNMEPNTKLKPHRGWGNHSNYVLRCHWGIDVPGTDLCYVSVADSTTMEHIRYQENGKWLVFDDSKFHYAENMSDKWRTVLILDIERPDYIKKGTSEVDDSDELKKLLENFR